MEIRLDPITPRRIKAAADNLRPAARAGMERVAGQAQRIAIRRAGQIYKRSIPTRAQVNAYNRKGGKSPKRVGGRGTPAWTRSGNLMKAVEAAPHWDSDTTVRLTADVDYGGSRHDLGVTRMPKRPALGIVRRNPFFLETAVIIEPQAPALFADGFRAKLKELSGL